MAMISRIIPPATLKSGIVTSMTEKTNFPAARNPRLTMKPVRIESRTTRCRTASFIPSVREIKRGRTPIASMAMKIGIMANSVALISQDIVTIQMP